MRAAGAVMANETNTTMEFDTNPTALDLNELMISTASSINPQDLDATPIGPTQIATTNNPSISNNNPNQTTIMTSNIGQISTSVNNTTHTTATMTRTLLVDNISPVNPNNVETFAIRTRQQHMGTNF
jgi:hypothetical protein